MGLYPKTTTDQAAETRAEPDCMVGPVVEARRGGHDCMVGLECFLDIVRALGMGSCLSVTGDSAAGYGRVSSSAPGSKRRRRLTGNSSSPAGATSPTNSMEMWLHRVPGRLFLNGFSDVASLFSKQGKKGVNQDAMIAWEVSFALRFHLNYRNITCICL